MEAGGDHPSPGSWRPLFGRTSGPSLTRLDRSRHDPHRLRSLRRPLHRIPWGGSNRRVGGGLRGRGMEGSQFDRPRPVYVEDGVGPAASSHAGVRSTALDPRLQPKGELGRYAGRSEAAFAQGSPPAEWAVPERLREPSGCLGRSPQLPRLQRSGSLAWSGPSSLEERPPNSVEWVGPGVVPGRLKQSFGSRPSRGSRCPGGRRPLPSPSPSSARPNARNASPCARPRTR